MSRTTANLLLLLGGAVWGNGFRRATNGNERHVTDVVRGAAVPGGDHGRATARVFRVSAN